MKYVNKSFSIPPASLPDGVNMHGQSWEDIFGVARGEGVVPEVGGDANRVLVESIKS